MIDDGGSEYPPLRETCSRCGREAPPFLEGPDGAVAQGWLTLEGPPEFDTYEDPRLDGLPVIVGIQHAWYGHVCPDCQMPHERFTDEERRDLGPDD